MLFGRKKKEEKPEPKKPELLRKENIRMNCTPMEKEDVIRAVGRMLCDSGYVEEGYIDGMLKRELSFSTNMGNAIALPHGVEEAKRDIKASGIAVMTFPEGVDWGSGNPVRLVIGIAGVGDEHLTILGNIAGRLCTPEDVEALLAGSVDEVYRILTEEE